MTTRQIKCTIVRGGTSKGVYIERDELPPFGPERDKVILALYGTPDKRQIDGLGGADKLTSKTAIMGPPTRPDCDIDYHFGQVGTALPTIDWKSNCGNISAGAACYAVYKGYVKATGPSAAVRIHQVNTGRRLLATVPVDEDGMPATEGDFEIGGVPGTGARIDLDFSDFTGCILHRGLLPTGSPVDRIEVPRLGKLDVSVVDVANLCAFVRASDVGMDYTEDIESLQANNEILTMLESIRSAVARHVGFVTENVDYEMKVRMNPLLFVVGTPRQYTTLNGKVIEAESFDLFSRSFARWEFSKAYPGTGSIGTGVACTVAGTIPAEAVRGGAPTVGEARKIRVGHPSGILVVDAAVSNEGGELKAIRGSVGRTARVLMEGVAFVRA